MYGAGAAFFCLEPEPTQVGRSRSRLRDLGHQELEPEPPKKVAAPQHCINQVVLCKMFITSFNILKTIFCITGSISSVAEPLEPPLLGRLRSRSRFFCWSEPGAGAALFKAAPAASFRQAKKKSLVLVSNMTLRAV